MTILTLSRFAAGVLLGTLLVAPALFAQSEEGPQNNPPAPANQVTLTKREPAQTTPQYIVVPTGTRIAVVLENGISTGTAKPGDSAYFRTSFPITIQNKVVIPVGSYLRGEITAVQRPGRVKGKGELRLKLNTLILPNGYTVDLNAAPQSTDSDTKTKTDSEGTITGPGGKGKDVATVATTTATGAGIGAIAGGGKGAGIGAGIGGVAGLAAVLLSRGPEAQLPRGSAMDLQLERDLRLDANQIHYHTTGQAMPVPVPAPQVDQQ